MEAYQHRFNRKPDNAPTAVIYSATKAAVDSITQVLAKELERRKIRVNSINPGGVETEGTQLLGMIGSYFEKQLVSQTRLGELASLRTSHGSLRSWLPMTRGG